MFPSGTASAPDGQRLNISFRTKMCTKVRCSRINCNDAHSAADRRCLTYARTGQCPGGTRCLMKHYLHYEAVSVPTKHMAAAKAATAPRQAPEPAPRPPCTASGPTTSRQEPDISNSKGAGPSEAATASKTAAAFCGSASFPDLFLPDLLHRTIATSAAAARTRSYQDIGKSYLADLPDVSAGAPAVPHPDMVRLVEVELAQNLSDVRRYDMPHATLQSVGHRRFKLTCPGLGEKRPSVVPGDTLWLSPITTSGDVVRTDHKQRAVVVSVMRDYLLCKMMSAQRTAVGGSATFFVRFTVSRRLYAMQAVALRDRGCHRLTAAVLLTRMPRPLPISARVRHCVLDDAGRRGLNSEQAAFVRQIVLEPAQRCHLLHGPPGTGKTTTIVSVLAALVAHVPNAKVLVCTPANLSADLIVDRLGPVLDELDHCTGPSPCGVTACGSPRILRVHASSRNPLRPLWSPEVQRHSGQQSSVFDALSRHDSADKPAVRSDGDRITSCPPFDLHQIRAASVVVSTIATAGKILSRAMEDSLFLASATAEASAARKERRKATAALRSSVSGVPWADGSLPAAESDDEYTADLISPDMSALPDAEQEAAKQRRERRRLQQAKDTFDFTHVVIDEAGQATEPEVLSALRLTNADRAKLILAGDPMQLGPVLRSRVAAAKGLGRSTLERLMADPDIIHHDTGAGSKVAGVMASWTSREQALQQADKAAADSLSDPPPTSPSAPAPTGVIETIPAHLIVAQPLVSMLLDNYRAHRAIVGLYNPTYGGKLRAKGPASLVDSLRGASELFPRGIPVHLRDVADGTEAREADSPSWFNQREVDEVMRAVRQALASGLVQPYEIVILTPYLKQCRKLRDALAAAEAEEPLLFAGQTWGQQQQRSSPSDPSAPLFGAPGHRAPWELRSTNTVRDPWTTEGGDEAAFNAAYLDELRRMEAEDRAAEQKVQVRSVEEFQGRESKLVIITTVRSDSVGLRGDGTSGLGFVSQPKSLNVALSRAAAGLVIVGNAAALAKDRRWGEVVRRLRSTSCVSTCEVPPAARIRTLGEVADQATVDEFANLTLDDRAWGGE